jgi:hypothetical protein
MSGAPLVQKLACKAGMPDWPLVRADAVLQDVLDAANARPTLPEHELRTGKLWLKEAIDIFAQRWERKPGRPRKSQVALPASDTKICPTLAL